MSFFSSPVGKDWVLNGISIDFQKDDIVFLKEIVVEAEFADDCVLQNSIFNPILNTISVESFCRLAAVRPSIRCNCGIVRLYTTHISRIVTNSWLILIWSIGLILWVLLRILKLIGFTVKLTAELIMACFSSDHVVWVAEDGQNKVRRILHPLLL